jgi:hypothetical protein
MFLYLIRSWVFLLALTTTNCLFITDEKISQGGGSDTETLTGAVSLSNGKPAARILIKLVPSNYNPSQPDTGLIKRVMTDDMGQFRFEKLSKTKFYNAIAGKPQERAWAFAESLQTGDSGAPIALSMAKVFLISLEYQGYTAKDSGIAYFPGTDILTRCNGISTSVVDSVPAGVLHIVVKSRAGWTHDTTLTSTKDTADVKADQNGITCAQ